MKILDVNNIFELNQQCVRNCIPCNNTERRFLEDFNFYLRNKDSGSLIKIMNPVGKNYIVKQFFENKLIEVINAVSQQLLLRGKSYCVILDNANLVPCKEDKAPDGKYVLYNTFANLTAKGIANWYFKSADTKIYKISRRKVVEVKLSNLGYPRNFFVKPLHIIDANQTFLYKISRNYPQNFANICKEYDIKHLLVTKNIYWNYHRFGNGLLTVPYLCYRAEKFYNIRVKVFRYIIDKFNSCLSRLCKINFRFITISDEICELNLYDKYINNEITLNELQEQYRKSFKI